MISFPISQSVNLRDFFPSALSPLEFRCEQQYLTCLRGLGSKVV